MEPIGVRVRMCTGAKTSFGSQDVAFEHRFAIEHADIRSKSPSPTSGSRLPSSRMLPAVNGKDNDVRTDCAEVHRIRKPIQDRSPYFSAHQPKLHRVVSDPFDDFVQRGAELAAETRPPAFIPVSSLKCYGFSLGTKADVTIHSRSISFRRTSSQGIEDSGCWMCSIQRRSSSAACSTVSSRSLSRSASERLSHNAIASSARSRGGSFRSSERRGDMTHSERV